ncbi:MAG TPA: membrane dipeptidase [Thermohalobaculum sp.]|nr:membrane dipeptidase [Thermohalobaculum sp.]
MNDRTVPVFDGHNDTILKLERAARRGEALDFASGAEDLDIDLPRARAAGFAGGFFAMFTPALDGGEIVSFDRGDPRRYAPVERPAALDFTLAMFARLRRLAAELPDDVALCSSAAEIGNAMDEGRIAILPHVEGAECIDTDLNALEVLHAAGLRSLGLVWSRPNAFAIGAPIYADESHEAEAGLTDAGRALVRECAALGVMIDLSHLNAGGFWEVARMEAAPLVATHSNAHALSPCPRNLTDDQLRAVAGSGGVVGLNFNAAFLRADCADNPDVPLATLLRHIDHLLGILGEEGVALGSDFDGCTLPAEIADVGGLPRLVAAMRQAGYGEELIGKICRRNWLELLARIV